MKKDVGLRRLEELYMSFRDHNEKELGNAIVPFNTQQWLLARHQPWFGR